ncbi:MAG: GreA/GreB family elongation factor [Opitutaceae bacterium]
MDKPALRAAILAELRAEQLRQARAAADAHEEATSEESRPENKWDTHSQEAAYLAEGQSRQVQEAAEAIGLFAALPLPAFSPEDPVALGALVTVDSGGHVARYLLGPRAGGLTVATAEGEVMVLTPQSPLGRQVLGRRVGDEVVTPRGGRAISARITAIT